MTGGPGVWIARIRWGAETRAGEEPGQGPGDEPGEEKERR